MKKVLHEQRNYRQRRIAKTERSRWRRISRSRKCAPAIVTVDMTSPSIISISNKHYRSKLVKFLKNIRVSSKRTGARVRLNFSDVTRMNSDATLLLWAEICRIRASATRANFILAQPTDAKCRQVFTQIGLARCFNCQETETSDDDVVHWRAVSGSGVDGEKYAEDLMAPYIDVLPEHITKSLWIGVQEAMTNVKHHAYILPRDSSTAGVADQDGNWWMFSQEKDKRLTVLICDLGAGIPRTVPVTRKESLATVVRWMRLHKRSDADVLSAVLKKTVSMERPLAEQETSSRTLKQYRGKGFYNIVKTVRSVSEGIVSIHSNRGHWQSTHPKDQRIRNYKTSIGGTIISWQIPVEKENEKRD